MSCARANLFSTRAARRSHSASSAAARSRARRASVATLTRPASSLLRQRIVRAVNAELSAKGMREVANEADASLLVTEHINVEQKLRVNTTNYGYGYGRWGYYGAGYTDTSVDQYEQGTLIIDFIDAKSKQLVWRGMAQSRLREMATPEEREARVRAAVSAILEKYPPSK